MDSCYSGDRIVGAHIHTGIEEPQQKNLLEQSVIDYTGEGGLNMVYCAQILPSISAVIQNIWSA